MLEAFQGRGGGGGGMPSLCWSFLRLPVAWIVVVTSLSSLFANCQCLLRGLPQVFRATSPIRPRFVGHFWDCLLLGLLLSHLFPPFLPIASAYWEDCRQFSGPRHLLLLPFRRPRYGGAYQSQNWLVAPVFLARTMSLLKNFATTQNTTVRII